MLLSVCLHVSTPQIHIDFETDPNLLALQDKFPEDFFIQFEKGVQVRPACVLLVCA